MSKKRDQELDQWVTDLERKIDQADQRGREMCKTIVEAADKLGLAWVWKRMAALLRKTRREELMMDTPITLFDLTKYTRKATLEAYRAALSSGLINAKRKQVFQWVWEHGPCIQADAAIALLPRGTTNWGVITTRFSELVAQDVLDELGLVIDPRTGKHATLYDVSGRPAKPYKPKKPLRLWMVYNSEAEYGCGYVEKEKTIEPFKWQLQQGKVKLYYMVEAKPPPDSQAPVKNK